MADSKLTALTGLSVPALDDLLYGVDVSDTTDDAAGSSRSLLLSRLLGLAGVQPGGRLTTESGVAVSTSDRTAQSTLRYTPFLSDYLRMYDGTRIREYVFTEFNLTLSSLTSDKNYDVWSYDSSGSPTLDLTAWTNDTTRATALAWQSGLGWVKSGTPTRLWLGTIRTTGTTTTEDSAAKRFVANAYNRVWRPINSGINSTSHSYGTAAFRNWNNGTTTQVAAVFALGGDVNYHAIWYMYFNGSSTGEMLTTVSFSDSTGVSGYIGGNPSAVNLRLLGEGVKACAPGYITSNVQEYGGGNNNGTWLEAGNFGEVYS